MKGGSSLRRRRSVPLIRWLLPACSSFTLLAAQCEAQVYERVYTFNPFNASARGTSLNGLVQGNDGNFYGTASEGGGYGSGTLFKVTPNGVVFTLVDFANTTTGENRGGEPLGGLIQ